MTKEGYLESFIGHSLIIFPIFFPQDIMNHEEALTILFCLLGFGLFLFFGIYVPTIYFFVFYYVMSFYWLLITLAFCCYFSFVHLEEFRFTQMIQGEVIFNLVNYLNFF